MAGLAGTGDRVEAPRPRAGPGVVGVEEAADPRLASADADHHLPVERQRSRRDAVALLVVRHLRLPADDARRRVEGHETAVERAHEHGAVENGHPAVGGPVAEGA